MPNYVKNVIRFQNATEAEAVKSFMEGGFDFNKLTPMAKSLKICAGSCTDDALSLLYHTGKRDEAPAFLRTLDELNERYPHGEGHEREWFMTPGDWGCPNPKTWEDLEAYADIIAENIRLYGHSDWYNWAYANWGTKWNAGEVYWSGDSVEFDTAWSDVRELMWKLADKFKISFDYYYADEDIGCNCGELYFFCEDGEIYMGEEVLDDPEMFAINLWGYESKAEYYGEDYEEEEE